MKSLRKRKRKSLKKNRVTKKARGRVRSSRRARGSMEDCCMCGSKFVKKKTALVPQECLIKYGKIRAHKVCPKCWWGEFAKEGVSHKCPGCVKGLPVYKDPKAGTVVDLTDEGLTEDIVEALEDGIEEEI
jgi:hypothetical protein